MNPAISLDMGLVSRSRSHLIVLDNDACRLARNVRGVRVLSGVAWVSYKGKDYILGRHQEMRFDDRREWAVVSNARRSPVILEILYE